MAKGRNTSVVSIRLPDEVIKRLKLKARNKGMSLSELLKQDAENLSILYGKNTDTENQSIGEDDSTNSNIANSQDSRKN